MARPANADAAATRQRILDSARELFAARGAGGSSIREIARGAGVSLAMVHHYFGSKEELYEACVDSLYEELESLRKPLEQAADAGVPLEQLAPIAVREGFRFARARRSTVRLLMRTVVEAGELAPERQRQVQLPFLADMSERFARQLGRSAAELRLALQSITFLVARYALSSDRELCLLVGADPSAAGALERALPAIEEHLAAGGLALLGLPRPRSRRAAQPATSPS